MKCVIQRVMKSKVEVEGQLVGQIGHGLMVLVGFEERDDEAVIDKMIDKLVHLRIFEDDQDKMNLSLLDVGGSILSISQFTLYANCKKGRRPSFVEAAKANKAQPLYDLFNKKIKDLGIPLEKGIFGADMQVSLINDGPVTIILDSDEL